MDDFFKYDFSVSSIALAIFVPSGTGDTMHRNRKFHGIALNCEGLKKYTFDNGKIIYIQENECIYLPKYSNYLVESVCNGGCYAINFDLTEDITFNPFPYKPKNYQSLIELFSNAEQMWKLKKAGFHTKCKADLYNILYILQNEFHLTYIQKDKSNIIRPAIEYIKGHYFENSIRIAHLASLCGISEAYFRNLFLKLNGTSPIQYINNLKISRAKELILSGDYAIHDIARLSGFSDDSYFSRKFKKHTGFSPAEFRKINE